MSRKVPKYISIEGNIGSGKTTLAKMLATEFGMRPVLEEFSENTFLKKFYEDGSRYAFPLEVSFLVERFEQLQNAFKTTDLFSPGVVSDYLFEKSLIFARNNLTEEQFALFLKIYRNLHREMPAESVVLYLHRPIDYLQEKITSRAREYEQNIHPDYLESIQKAYFKYLRNKEGAPVLVINLDKKDFIEDDMLRERLFDLIFKNSDPGFRIVNI